jgi:hypothetical protein
VLVTDVTIVHIGITLVLLRYSHCFFISLERHKTCHITCPAYSWPNPPFSAIFWSALLCCPRTIYPKDNIFSIFKHIGLHIMEETLERLWRCTLSHIVKVRLSQNTQADCSYSHLSTRTHRQKLQDFTSEDVNPVVDRTAQNKNLATWLKSALFSMRWKAYSFST